MPLSLADRLQIERHRRFVGRARELNFFQEIITTAELPFNVLHLFGPGGVGKTALLWEFARTCNQAQIPIIYLDARNVEPAPDSLLSAFRFVMGLLPLDSPLQILASQVDRQIILLDTYETLAPLDEWLRQAFLPQLPENTLTVIAGRHSPTSAWRADSGWQALIHILPLDNLSPEESCTYLSKRDIPATQHHAVLAFTHGYPLALSLVADVFAQGQDIHFQPTAVPNVIKALLEKLTQKASSPVQRMALEAAAMVRLTTETLLAEMLATSDVHELFTWLRELSFIEPGRLGLFPHDLAREVLAADLRWRNPDRYAELHLRARNYYTRRLAQTQGQEQQHVLFDYIFLHRDNAAVRPYFTWRESSSLFTDSFREIDQPALVQLVTQHEGEASAHLIAHWLKRQPQGVLIFRDAEQQPVGFVAMIALHQTTTEDQIDPAVGSTRGYLQEYAPLRPGEGATLLRFWMARDTYQAVSPIQSLIFLNFMQHHRLAGGLAFTFFACAEPNFWAELFAYADLARIPKADFEVSGRHYGVYGHDWRVVAPKAWQALLAQREIDASAQAMPMGFGQVPTASYVHSARYSLGEGYANANAPSQTNRPRAVLSQPEFVAAVRDALHNFSRPNVLHRNPLLQSRLVVDQTVANASKAEQIAALQTVLRKAAESLQSSPRETKYYRVLYHTYLHPAPTQEQSAELLGLPFSTFRRYLKTGVMQVVDLLWQREIG